MWFSWFVLLLFFATADSGLVGKVPYYKKIELYFAGVAVLLLVAHGVSISRKWVDRHGSLSFSENAVILIFLAASTSAVFAVADYKLYVDSPGDYLVDHDYAAALVQNANDAIGGRRIADSLNEVQPIIRMLAEIEKAGISGRQIVCDPSLMVPAPGSMDELRSVMPVVAGDLKVNCGYRPISAGSPEAYYAVYTFHSLPPLSIKANGKTFSVDGALRDRRNELLGLLNTESAYVPVVAFEYEWLMDFGGARPWLVKPIANRGRALVVGFECSKIFFFAVFLGNVLGRISRSS
jgi:hypothetical protein